MQCYIDICHDDTITLLFMLVIQNCDIIQYSLVSHSASLDISPLCRLVEKK